MSPGTRVTPRRGDPVREGDRRARESDPVLRKGSRDELREATGDTKLPALELPDGTIITHSRRILAWISRQS